MNPAKTFFKSGPFSRASLVGVTHEEVTSFTLVRLGEVAHARASMWHHVAFSHTSPVGTIGGPATLRCASTSRASSVGTIGKKFKPT
jgi:hypothetical protein